MYRLNQIKIKIHHNIDDLLRKVARLIRVNESEIDLDSFKILNKSIDARDKNNIFYVYNVLFDFKKDKDGRYLIDVEKVIKKHFSIEKYNPIIFNPIVKEKDSPIINENIRPIIVGFGPAGIFASYIFALNGLKPIIFERGKSLDERVKDTEKFFDTMELDEESNVCFGEGGAGAFSDGKLNTGNKDRDGIYRFILETFVKYGASENILYDNMPHIGTDKLIKVIKNIRDEIIALGGEIHYGSKWSYEECKNSNMKEGTPIILAVGNSSRDTFRELISNGFDIKPKTIAVGYRIAHKQSLISDIQYGNVDTQDEKSALPPATYKLVYNVDKYHSVYSFCMCPGGYIINSSNKKGMLAINGMSYNDRDGEYANSAIVVTVNVEDIIDEKDFIKISDKEKALKVIEFQEKVETDAYNLEDGYIPYIKSDDTLIDENAIFKGRAKYSKNLKSIYENAGIRLDIDKILHDGLRHFNKLMNGFYDDEKEYLIAGVETRTSSPIHLDRDENYMCNVENYYPAGEGFGHGGGIMSSAADGIKVAMRIIKNM